MGNIERSIWINAPRQRVWDAVTEPQHLEKWFLPTVLGAQMKRDASNKLFVCMGPMEMEVAVLESLESPRKVTSRNLPDQQFVTTYILDESNGGTQVTVTLSGFEALPADASKERLDPSGAGWEQALQNLKAYLDGVELPYPYIQMTSIFGYRREAPQKFAIERSIWIKASRERVWKAITDPEHIEKWFSPGTAWRLSALQVGGRLYVHDAENNAEMYAQVIDLIDPPKRFITHSAEPPPHVTDYVLTEENGGTRLTLIHSGYEHEGIETRDANMEQNAFGFGMMLQNIKATVEGSELARPAGF